MLAILLQHRGFLSLTSVSQQHLLHLRNQMWDWSHFNPMTFCTKLWTVRLRADPQQHQYSHAAVQATKTSACRLNCKSIRSVLCKQPYGGSFLTSNTRINSAWTLMAYSWKIIELWPIPINGKSTILTIQRFKLNWFCKSSAIYSLVQPSKILSANQLLYDITLYCH